MSDTTNLSAMLTGVMSQMSDICDEFMQMKDADTMMANSIKSKVPPPFLCRIYEIATLITNFRTARWAAYVNYERTKPVETEQDPTTNIVVPVAAPAVTDVVASLTPAPAPVPTEKIDKANEAEKALTYQQFVKKMLPEVKASHTDWTTQQIISEVAKLWKEQKKTSGGAIEHVDTDTSSVSSAEKKPKKSAKKEEKVEKKVEKEPKKAEKAEKEPAKAEKEPKKAEKSEKEVKKMEKEPKKPKKESVRAPEAPTMPDMSPPAAAPAAVPVVTAPAPAEDAISNRRKAIPKHVKSLVWNRFVGENRAEAMCLCCRATRISVTNFHCGHVIAEAKGGDLTVPNLRPICAPCNLSMGTMSMNEFAKTYFGWEVV